MLPLALVSPSAALADQPAAIVRYDTSAEWKAVLAGGLPSGVQAAPGDPPEVVDYPTESQPVDVEVVADSRAPDGSWLETVRLTIRSGGAMGQVSELVYGNVLHVDEVFKAAQKLDPTLRSPAFVKVGQVVELTVDPTRVFVLKSVTSDDQKLVRTFANGVQETTFRKPANSVVRIVTFPKAPNGASFHFPDGNMSNLVTVPSGGRIVDYQYRAGESFASVVSDSLGAATAKAAAEITKQTGWQPVRWPPKSGEAKRAILGPVEDYRPEPFNSLEVAPPEPDARAAFDQLAQDRQRVGIYPIQQLNSGILYQVMVADPTATARDVSRLLYGDDHEYLAIAEKAGFPLPPGEAEQFFNPNLFGTSFQVSVDYTQEYFPYSDSHDDALKARVVKLLNGTVIEEFDAAQTDGHGVWEIVRYPSGYKQITYRPQSLMLTLGQAVAYVRGIPDLGLDPATADALRRRYAAEFLWTWSVNVPREPGDIPDAFDVRKIGNTDVVVVKVGPSAPMTRPERLLDRVLNQSPLVGAVGVTLLGALLVLFVGIVSQVARRPGREM